jgi:hypothetical protein
MVNLFNINKSTSKCINWCEWVIKQTHSHSILGMNMSCRGEHVCTIIMAKDFLPNLPCPVVLKFLFFWLYFIHQKHPCTILSLLTAIILCFAETLTATSSSVTNPWRFLLLGWTTKQGRKKRTLGRLTTTTTN